MKYILTLEKYQSYKDYETGRSKWGSPADIEEEVRMLITNTTYGDIAKRVSDIKFKDQSTDKGIKWEVTLKGDGTDTIHLYKIGNWRGQWEWYLNKKKSTQQDIIDYLQQKYMSKVEVFLRAVRGYDYYAEYIDNGAQYRRASDNNKRIVDLFNNLSSSEKKEALKELQKGDNKDKVSSIFKI